MLRQGNPGGPGTGNPYHDPETGRFAEAPPYQVVYQGTTDERVEEIKALEEGLKPGDQDIVFTTTSKETAEAYAEAYANTYGGKPVVLEVHIPNEDWTSKASRIDGRENEIGFKGVVKPEWLSVATLGTSNKAPLEEFKGRIKKLDKALRGKPISEKLKALREAAAVPRQEVPAPDKTITGYKIFNMKDSKGHFTEEWGEGVGLYPAMVASKRPIPVGSWIAAEFEPTGKLEDRGGWHMTALPMAPQMRNREGLMQPWRVWAECAMGGVKGTVPPLGQTPPTDGFYIHHQGGKEWMIGGAIKINRVLPDSEVASILKDAGFKDDAKAEQPKRSSGK